GSCLDRARLPESDRRAPAWSLPIDREPVRRGGNQAQAHKLSPPAPARRTGSASRSAEIRERKLLLEQRKDRVHGLAIGVVKEAAKPEQSDHKPRIRLAGGNPLHAARVFHVVVL